MREPTKRTLIERNKGLSFIASAVRIYDQIIAKHMFTTRMLGKLEEQM
jgi:hypothetical protein